MSKKSVHEFSIEELDKELIARGAQVPDAEKFNFPDKEGTPERNAMAEGEEWCQVNYFSWMDSKREYTEKQIRKIWGGNFMQVFKKVEKISRK